MKTIRSTMLPEHIQKEMQAMHSALKTKYGSAAMLVGIAVENLSQLCNMIKHAGKLTDAEREEAYVRGCDTCAEMLDILAKAVGADRQGVLAVALAHREFTTIIEEEILGQAHLADAETDAAAAIAKAATKH